MSEDNEAPAFGPVAVTPPYSENEVFKENDIFETRDRPKRA